MKDKCLEYDNWRGIFVFSAVCKIILNLSKYTLKAWSLESRLVSALDPSVLTILIVFGTVYLTSSMQEGRSREIKAITKTTYDGAKFYMLHQAGISSEIGIRYGCIQSSIYFSRYW